MRVSLLLLTAAGAAATVPPDCDHAPAPLTPVEPKAGSPRPHIVLFVIDDFGWASLGLHSEAGENGTHTPHFDAAAREGTLLDRHYTFRWCAPTRSAFMTGRLPYHVLEHTNTVSGGMNMIPAKLKQVGYKTHQVGKWHLGCNMQWMTPAGRGFDTSFGYLSGGEDHYTHHLGSHGYFGCPGTDLYETDRPAYTGEGVYGAYLYNDRVQKIIREHNVSDPLFLYVATQDTHGPDQAPDRFVELFDPQSYTHAYAVYNGMGAAADELYGNMTDALRTRGMYDNTLIVFSSDNGGPASIYTSSKASNNWPLRAGKKTDFEGGIRVSAFVSGGFLPTAARGKTLDGYLHCADWYPTLCGLAGGSDCMEAASAARNGVPAVDGFDMWPYLTGAVAESPRTEIMVSRCEQPHIPISTKSPNCSGAFISGQYKLVVGMQYYAFWQGKVYPNATTDHALFDKHFDCGLGCVFDIRADPAETVDLASSKPALLAQLRQRYFELNATQYDGPRCPPNEALCEAFVTAHQGYLGPIYKKEPPAPPPRGPFSLKSSDEQCLVPAAKGVGIGACGAAAAMWYTGEEGPAANALQTQNGTCLKMYDVSGGSCASWQHIFLGTCGGGPALNNSFSLIGSKVESNQCSGRCILSDSGTLGACTSTTASGWSLVP